MSRAPWLIALALSPLRLVRVKASTGLPSNVPNTERFTPITGPLSLGEQPFMLLLIMEFPDALRARHHVEIIEIIAVQRRARVIPFGYERHLAIMHRDGFIERTVLRVDALEGKALGRPDTVII